MGANRETILLMPPLRSEPAHVPPELQLHKPGALRGPAVVTAPTEARYHPTVDTGSRSSTCGLQQAGSAPSRRQGERARVVLR